ncbi:hypothetical protein UFOVP916_13 [uncultured Caudovirales phage]|uniref:Uncharacterized protein n=1 Tax=uncultured Caudovirales phage TaxID=2100421 RepID=A0A6J5SUE1_9CAUD|nr:hypothetical protein UFOVP827_34 [uncultured Caudovirales phage]CAB4171433.1 hypothetical protein UFOVP916_13 [uncultured Caudovirales phage]CAB4177391.1 hypothetical protein UFOVP1001_37 [uncultured Caudovirales phage]CAB4199368.1 hypothetical protein UFOVP1338_39 [uncultured Caudovirales phage]CAB4213457.1 hypothetical protein UFOVP1447_34 [uncultured Caudovirales phage]
MNTYQITYIAHGNERKEDVGALDIHIALLTFEDLFYFEEILSIEKLKI